MKRYEPPVLECQSCASKIRDLSTFEREDIRDRPYNYIAYCKSRGCQEQARFDMEQDMGIE